MAMPIDSGERGREREGGEKRQSVTSHTRAEQGPNLNPGMCPDWKSNLRRFDLWDDTQAAKPPQLWLSCSFLV